MILYTVMPEALIFAEEDEQQPERFVMEWQGSQVEVERSGPHKGRIVRLLSTDPRVFLHTYFQPGTEVECP